MAYGSSRVKGITIEIGGDTTKLDKALGGVNHNLTTIQKDLKAVEDRLKLDPSNTELLAQKQRLLADAVSETAQRAKILEGAAEGMNQALSEGKVNAKQYEAFNLELDITRADLKKAEKAVSDFNDELKRTDGPAGDAAKGIEKVDDAAGDAGPGLGSLEDFAQGAADSLGLTDLAAAGVAATLGSALGDAAMAAVQWMMSLDEATEEYRVAMGKLNTAFETAGYSTETAMETYRGFYAILGDTDTATEASQLLANLADNQEDLSRWVEIAAGVYGTFGDSLPIEGLIEAANETAKTGQVTGVLADALNWVGINEDNFNKTLEQNLSVSDRANLIMTTLFKTYDEAADSFYKNNEAIVASREEQAKLDESLALVGEAVSNVKTELLAAFGPSLVDLAQAAANALNAIAEGIKAIGDFLDDVDEKASGLTGFLDKLGGAFGKGMTGISFPSFGKGRSVAEPFALTAISAEDLPHLAQGTVTRANNPFLAVVGDNPTEQEVISPLSTIKQAVMEANAASGGGGGNMRVTVNFTGSMAQLVRMMQPQITVETNRRGPQYVN